MVMSLMIIAMIMMMMCTTRFAVIRRVALEYLTAQELYARKESATFDTFTTRPRGNNPLFSNKILDKGIDT
jgi:hypothetical protein